MTQEMHLKRLDEGLWAVDAVSKVAPGFYLPVRCTIAKLSDGGLFLYSPSRFTHEVASEIGKLGPVTTLFSPNLYHNSFIASAQRHFPEATLVGPTGMANRVKRLSVDREINASETEPFGPDFRAVFVGGAPKFNEILLQHRPTGTLLVADYFFNIHETKGFLTPFILDKLSGALKKPAQSKLWRKVAKDKRAMRKSAETLLSLDFRRIVMCHGDVLEDGREMSERQLAWLMTA
jgi:hypothetical protein